MKQVGSRRVWSVREVTQAVARRIGEPPSVWMEAEVQNLRRGGGQVYFTLQDGHRIDGSMNAVVFDRLLARPAEGALVQAYGRVEFWAERSLVRMRIERMELAGEGLLRARIEALRGALEAEGLLAESRKRRPPVLPRRIGLITSRDGAARDDVLRNLWERFPGADVVFHAVPVQGDGAPAAIVAALRRLGTVRGVDVVIVTRGGGSLEDLMAFNSEEVCRAVAASRAPVVSAVGHERDVTLCDLVADVRVSTPTAAARAVVPDAVELTAALAERERRLGEGLRRTHGDADRAVAARSGALVAALRRCGARVEGRVHGLEARMVPALRRHTAAGAAAVAACDERLLRAVRAGTRERGARVDTLATLLEALGPERTVARGYAIIRRPHSGAPVVDAAGLEAGMDVRIHMRDGDRGARIVEAGE
ncbi:MAG: exodeoxyribonuclease VII large subunit [Thermoleophilia bacterium]